MKSLCNRSGLTEAVSWIEAESNRSADTHLIRVPLLHHPGMPLYLKDERSI